MRTTGRIGLPKLSQDIRLERAEHNGQMLWRLWLSRNNDMTGGTFLCLWDDGSVTRVTLLPNGGEQEIVIKPPEMGSAR
jgi:hypothetical protein